MLEKNKADSRKYFIFKIRDLVHNSFHTLEEKRTESLLQYMGICISTYDELRASLDPTKLKRSYEGLLEGLDYQMQIHPFHKLDLYQNDFSHLHQLINLANEARDKELHNIHLYECEDPDQSSTGAYPPEISENHKKQTALLPLCR